MSNNSIRVIDKILSSATCPGQSGLGSNGNKEVLDIPQISKEWFNVISRTLFGLGSYPSVEIMLADWDNIHRR